MARNDAISHRSTTRHKRIEVDPGGQVQGMLALAWAPNDLGPSEYPLPAALPFLIFLWQVMALRLAKGGRISVQAYILFPVSPSRLAQTPTRQIKLEVSYWLMSRVYTGFALRKRRCDGRQSQLRMAASVAVIDGPRIAIPRDVHAPMALICRPARTISNASLLVILDRTAYKSWFSGSHAQICFTCSM